MSSKAGGGPVPPGARRPPTSGGGNRGLALLLGGIVAMGFSYPFWLLMTSSSSSGETGRIDPNKDKLRGQAKIRGAFLNTGSKDAGPDPKGSSGSSRTA